MVMSENDFRNNPQWILKLLLRCLFVAASLSFVLQFTVPDAPGSSNSEITFHLTSAPGSVTAALEKSSHTLKNTRKKGTKGGGPDTLPEVPSFSDLPSYHGRTEPSSRLTYSAFIAEHILLRNGYNAISVRAPPKHFSS